MTTISYHDLRYKRDHVYHKKIKKSLDKLNKKNPQFSSFLSEGISSFYQLVSAAIQIDSHPNVKLIKAAIEEKYKSGIIMHVFLYESTSPRAMCTNREYIGEDGNLHSELIVLVSQHFFNNLDFQQQISVLSHELCHKILEHTDIPAKRILESGIDLTSFRDFKLNLIKWSICSEISSDIFALHSTDYNPKIFSTSIIKYSSGVFALDSYDLISILLNQYEELSKSISSSQLTPHPILPLRIKIIQEVCKDEIIKYIGKKVTRQKKKELVDNFNDKIDKLIFNVYPEMFEEGREDHIILYLNLGTCVILADERITKEEENHLMTLAGDNIFPGQYLTGIKEQLKDYSYKELIEKLLNESIEYCTENDLSTSEIIPIIRFMLFTAAADGVEVKELKVVHKFSKHFGISKEEIVLLLTQVTKQVA